ncbi:unnamed protein product [Protopolystoma xenopodis]|uniref:Dynein light chain n=1 Tax=Protopolystoma xenopodis TaxID=117903 RepID=A0A3S4ZFT0_9PLAT|nr:unnamed protein product [Protopolystoma xenopodis]
MATDRRAVIKNADMAEDMQQDAVELCAMAMEKYNIEKDIAAYIKKEFDRKYNPTWHCIVGRNFGRSVSQPCVHNALLHINSYHHASPRVWCMPARDGLFEWVIFDDLK